MTKKLRYFGLIINLLAVAVIFLLNDGRSSYRTVLGFISKDVERTVAFKFLEEIVREFGVRSSKADSVSYVLWTLLFVGACIVAWKYRALTAETLNRAFSRFHEKV